MIIRFPLIGTRLSANRGDEADPIHPIPWHRWLPQDAPEWEAHLVGPSLDLDQAEAEYEIRARDPAEQATLDALLQDFDQQHRGIGAKRLWGNGDYVDLSRMRRTRPDGSVEAITAQKPTGGL